jgi:predicted extracellular nuclease
MRSQVNRLTFRRSLLLALALLFCIASPAFGQTGLVISQIYGGGGNSGATYTNDFIELYNSSSAAINLGGLSVQYASATGTSWNAATLPSFSLAAGHYFLIQAAAGSTAAASLPTPDLILTLGPPSNVSQSFLINLSATAGKVALVSNTTPLTVACPTGATIIDFVGYGSTANCSEGNAPAPTTTTNTQSIIRTVSSTDSNNNAADFSVVSPPNPRNSSYGSSGTPITATGLATPASVTSGNNVVLTVAVTPGGSPTSTGLAVTANLSSIGGSNTQQFYDDGTNGDATPGDNIFSFSLQVNSTANGLVNLTANIADAQNRTATAPIALTVNQPFTAVPIDVIQGLKSTTGQALSAYVGQYVQTSGIVTAVISNGFFIQTPDGSTDGNPLTPEGIEVFTSSAPSPSLVAVGNMVQVVGKVQTYPDPSASHTPATELISPTVTLLSTGNPLPAPIALDATMLTSGGGLYQLTPYEGMRVSFNSLTAVSGTDGSITEASATASSNGYFYAVIGNTARPFREPGIDIRDPLVAGTPANVAHFDDNPERILVASSLSGGSSIELSTGAALSNVTGVLDFTYSSDAFYDPGRLILDATYDRTQVNTSTALAVQAVPAATASQFTVASFNIERFFNTSSSDNTYYIPAGVNLYDSNGNVVGTSNGQTATSSAPTLSSAAYQKRLKKVSLAVRTVLNNPDIVTLEEVENQTVANDIANQINSDAGSTLYTAYSTDNSTYYTQDGTGISVGFLVKNTVTNSGVTQFGQNETFSNGTITLNDRPWLALKAGIKRANAKDYPVTVIVNHMRSLSGINANTQSGINTRTKKELQAEDIAKYIQSLQASGTHVISGGDFNAFEFSDGYTDTLATYTNTNVLPADHVVQPGTSGLVTPPLINLTLSLPANQRWSYSEDGNAQVLDHIVVTPELATSASIAYAHIDADFPLTAYNDATTAARTSDHDPIVGYFAIPTPTTAVNLGPSSGSFGSVTLGNSSTGQVFTFNNTGETNITITSVAATGDYAVNSNCVGTLSAGSSCTTNVVFTPTAAGTRTGALNITTTLVSPVFSATLTGTGVNPSLPTLSSTTLDFGSVTLNTNSAAKTVTITNNANAPITVGSIAISGDYSQTSNCGTSIVASGTCTVSVIFKPTVLGTRTGTLTVTTTGAAATTLTTALTGVAPPLPTISPASADFGSQAISVGSTAKTITVTNSATVPVAVGVISLTGDYSQTNTCGTSIPASTTCAINVVFTPTATGTRNGTLTVTTTGAAATTLTTTLTGVGAAPDFTIAGSSGTTVTVSAGNSGSVGLTFTPAYGFNTSITITCAAQGTAPSGVACSVPASFTLGGSAVTQNITFSTTSRTLSSGLALNGNGLTWTSLALFSFSGILMLLAARARRMGRASMVRLNRIGGLFALILALCLPAIGCGGSSGPKTNPNGTPAGTYAYTVTATGGSQTHTQNVTLVVQ